MKSQDKNHGVQPIDILIWVFKAMNVLSWISGMITFGLIVYSLFNFNGVLNLPGGADYPVLFSNANFSSAVPWADTGSEAIMMSGLGIVKVDSVPATFALTYGMIVLSIIGLIILSLRFTVKILRSVRDGAFLLIENAIRLRWIGLMGVGIIVIDKIGGAYSAHFFSSQLNLDQIDLVSMNQFSFLNFEAILSALFLVVIAQVFKEGAKLKEESDLTV